MQHYLMLRRGHFCVNIPHIDKVMLLKARGSGNYDSPCISVGKLTLAPRLTIVLSMAF